MVMKSSVLTVILFALNLFFGTSMAQPATNIRLFFDSDKIAAAQEAAAKYLNENGLLEPELGGYSSYDFQGSAIVEIKVKSNHLDEHRAHEIVVSTVVKLQDRRREIVYLCTSGFVNTALADEKAWLADDQWRLDSSEYGATICESLSI
jgi:hypothetical protein